MACRTSVRELRAKGVHLACASHSPPVDRRRSHYDMPTWQWGSIISAWDVQPQRQLAQEAVDCHVPVAAVQVSCPYRDLFRNSVLIASYVSISRLLTSMQFPTWIIDAASFCCALYKAHWYITQIEGPRIWCTLQFFPSARVMLFFLCIWKSLA